MARAPTVRTVRLQLVSRGLVDAAPVLGAPIMAPLKAGHCRPWWATKPWHPTRLWRQPTGRSTRPRRADAIGSSCRGRWSRGRPRRQREPCCKSQASSLTGCGPSDAGSCRLHHAGRARWGRAASFGRAPGWPGTAPQTACFPSFA